MDITPLVMHTQPLITGYGADGFSLNEVLHPSALLIYQNTVQPWASAGMQDIQLSHFALLTETAPRPEVLLIGTGKTHQFLPDSLRQELKAAGINAETMATGSACRTYNVLVAEGRRVAAALLPI